MYSVKYFFNVGCLLLHVKTWLQQKIPLFLEFFVPIFELSILVVPLSVISKDIDVPRISIVLQSLTVLVFLIWVNLNILHFLVFEVVKAFDGFEPEFFNGLSIFINIIIIIFFKVLHSLFEVVLPSWLEVFNYVAVNDLVWDERNVHENHK